MCNPAIIVPAATMGVQALGSLMQNQQGAATAEANANLAGEKRRDALARGDQATLARQYQVQQAMGTQRAAMGASGTVANTGTNADILADTAKSGALDVATTRSNSLREAWGYEVEQANWEAQADSARASSDLNRTLLDPSGMLLHRAGLNIGGKFTAPFARS